MGNHAAPRRAASRSVPPIHRTAKAAHPALSPCLLYFSFNLLFFVGFFCVCVFYKSRPLIIGVRRKKEGEGEKE